MIVRRSPLSVGVAILVIALPGSTLAGVPKPARQPSVKLCHVAGPSVVKTLGTHDGSSNQDCTDYDQYSSDSGFLSQKVGE